jgi:hypothetical protein
MSYRSLGSDEVTLLTKGNHFVLPRFLWAGLFL